MSLDGEAGLLVEPEPKVEMSKAPAAIDITAEGGTPMAGPLTSAHAVTKLPAQDLGRAQRFYHDRLGLDPVEERDGGLRYVCGTTEFHLFLSSGAASGASTQLGFEVEDIDGVVANLRSRGLQFEPFDIAGFDVRDDIVVVPNNYPSKGTGERGAFFRDSEGNLLALGQATR
jgi:catechol 2,3-dioxygenase-like lactoylglutathione lyase family enzyme